MSVYLSILDSGARAAGPIGWAIIHSMRRNGRKTMVPTLDGSDARGTCHLRSREPLKKYLIKGAGVTIGRIRLKLGGPIGLLSGLNPLG